MIGMSTTTQDIVLYESEVELRTDIMELLSTRKEMRRTRRNRKTRYRKARFDNRVHSKQKGWVAPSIRHKIDTHIRSIKKVCEILPVSKIIIEIAQFDIQKLKNPDIEGTEYQQGEQMRFSNLREYVFHRDNYTCQWCKGKSKDPVLHMHHWNYWRGDHTDKPDSVITLCNTCNDSKNHKPEAEMLWGWKPKITNSYKDAATMNIMRWNLYEKAKEVFHVPVTYTYGYITKHVRIEKGLPKEHRIDARCISGNPDAKPLDYVFYQKKVRCHNRQIHKMSIGKGGIRKRNQAEYEVKGFRLFDKVSYQGKEYFIFGRRKSGFFDIRTLSGEKINKGSISCKKLKLIEKKKGFLTERRSDFLPTL